MSDGNTSNTDGKPDGPWAHSSGEGSQAIGRTVSRLLAVLNGKGDLARKTAHGPEPQPEPPRKPKKRKLRRKKEPLRPQSQSRGAMYALLFGLAVLALVLMSMFLIRAEVSMPTPQGILLTRIQMKGFEMAVRGYYVKYQRLPDGTPPDILSALAGENINGQNNDYIVFMSLRPAVYRFGRLVKFGDTDEEGHYLDGWGRPMTIETDHVNRRMWIRSLGPDGVDDRGGGDDIEMLVVPDE